MCLRCVVGFGSILCECHSRNDSVRSRGPSGGHRRRLFGSLTVDACWCETASTHPAAGQHQWTVPHTTAIQDQTSQTKCTLKELNSHPLWALRELLLFYWLFLNCKYHQFDLEELNSAVLLCGISGCEGPDTPAVNFHTAKKVAVIFSLLRQKFPRLRGERWTSDQSEWSWSEVRAWPNAWCVRTFTQLKSRQWWFHKNKIVLL